MDDESISSPEIAYMADQLDSKGRSLLAKHIDMRQRREDDDTVNAEAIKRMKEQYHKAVDLGNIQQMMHLKGELFRRFGVSVSPKP